MLELELDDLKELSSRCVNTALLLPSWSVHDRVRRAIVTVLEEEGYRGRLNLPSVFEIQINQVVHWREERISEN